MPLHYIIVVMLNLALWTVVKECHSTKHRYRAPQSSNSTDTIGNKVLFAKLNASNQSRTSIQSNNKSLTQIITDHSPKKTLNFSSNSQKEIVIGVLLPYTISKTLVQTTFKSGKYYASAFTLAIDDINRNQNLLPGYKVSYVWNDTKCLENNTLSQQFYQLTRDRRVDVFIGPGCHCSSAAKFAAALNIATISYMCGDPELSDKRKYPTFARTYPVAKQLTPSLIALLKNYNWNTVALVYDDNFLETKNHIKKRFTKEHIAISYEASVPSEIKYHLASASWDAALYPRLLKGIKENARIVIFLCSYAVAREGIHHAWLQGMTKGEFAFILFELSADKVLHKTQYPFQWFYAHYLQTYNFSTSVREEFGSVIILGPKAPQSNYKGFEKRLKKRLAGAPFYSKAWNGKINGTKKRKAESRPPEYGAYLYDAILLYANALNKTISQNKSIRDGRAIHDNLKNTVYQSILGYDMYVDERGDVEYNLTVFHKTNSRGKNSNYLLN